MMLAPGQRTNAIHYAKDAEIALYKLYAYLDDLDGLNTQAEAVNDLLESARSITKFLASLKTEVAPRGAIK